MEESSIPKGQDNTSNHANDSKNSSPLTNSSLTESAVPPTPHENNGPQNHSDQTPWWKDRHFVIQILVFAVGIYVAHVYYGQLCQMIESNKINRSSIESVQRAFVYMDALNFSPVFRIIHKERLNYMTASVSWGNNGTTPALKAISYFNVDSLPSAPDGDVFTGAKNLPTNPTYIGPKSRITQQIEKPLSFYSGTNDPKNTDFRNIDRGIYLWGWVSYEDVFQNKRIHVTEFCEHMTNMGINIQSDSQILRPSAMPQFFFSYGSAGKHNCIDEDCPDYAQLSTIRRPN